MVRTIDSITSYRTIDHVYDQFIVSLNAEIVDLEKVENKKVDIIRLKLEQLKRLGIANASFYASALLFLLAGLSKALFMLDILFDYFMLFGVLATTVGLTYLFIHSLKSVKIRQRNLEL